MKKDIYKAIMEDISQVVINSIDKHVISYHTEEINDLKKRTIDTFLKNFDINSIPENIRRKQYFDYEPYFNFVNLNNREWTIDENLNYIYESQENINIQTTREIITRLKNYYKFDEQYQFYVLSPNYVHIVNVSQIPVYYESTGLITLANFKKNVDIIIEEFAMGGYKMVRKKLSKDDAGREWVTLVFDPIRQDTISEQVRKHCRYIYHSTPIDIYDLIEEDGEISPQNLKRVYDYPEPRIYLYASDPDNDEYVKMMKNITVNRQRKDKNFNGDYYLLTIRTKKIPQDVEFYYDPHCTENCIFTTKPISLDAVDDKEVINFFKDF